MSFNTKMAVKKKGAAAALEDVLRPLYDRTADSFGLVNITVSDGTNFKVCYHSAGPLYLYRCTSSAFKRALRLR
jgi:hypothetical protein